MTSLDPDQLAALSAVIAEGTFDAAARSLHVTPSAISQRIKALETAAGRVLVSRTKPARATEAGAGLVRLARQVHALTADALRDLGADPAGPTVVPIAVNADSLATWFPDVFAAVDPRTLTFDLHRSDQDRTTDLLRDGTVMAAVTSEALPVAGCASTRLGRMTYRAAAAPEFARRWFADGATADALAAAPVVVYDRTDGLQDVFVRRRTRRVSTPPQHHVPDSGQLRPRGLRRAGLGDDPGINSVAARTWSTSTPAAPCR